MVDPGGRGNLWIPVMSWGFYFIFCPEFASSPGVNNKCSCPEEGLCGRETAAEEEEEEVERSMKLCRTGGGGGWDGGWLPKGPSTAKTQQKPQDWYFQYVVVNFSPKKGGDRHCYNVWAFCSVIIADCIMAVPMFDVIKNDLSIPQCKVSNVLFC